MMAAFEWMRDAMRELKTTGQVKARALGVFNDFVDLMGAAELDALGKKYNT